MKKLICLILLITNLNANLFAISKKQLDYLSYIALVIKLSDVCLKLNNFGIENNYSLYKYIPIKVETNGIYCYKTSLFNLVKLCKEAGVI